MPGFCSWLNSNWIWHSFRRVGLLQNQAILGISFCAMGVVAFAGALYLESITANTWHGDGMKA